MNDPKIALIRYGFELVAKVLGKHIAQAPFVLEGLNTEVWDNYIKILVPQPPLLQELTSIFSHIHLGDQKIKPQYFLPNPLTLEKDNIFPVATIAPQTISTQLWEGFLQDIGLLDRHRENPALLFEAFFYVMKKWGWSLPNLYGEPGVSLFEQWKAVSALVFASGSEWQSGPAEKFTLIGGDIPGIQEFVYTITSKGATKGLRGRSFFLQLLGEATVQAVLNEFALPSTNVIYAAGGNFMLLAPAGEDVDEGLHNLCDRLDMILLRVFQGDLSVCLDWVEIAGTEIGTNAFASSASRKLKEKIANRKRHRFSGIANKQWSVLFEPHGQPGARRCVICQVPIAEGKGIPMDEAEAEEERSFRCETCDGFQKLAEKIGQKQSVMVLTTDKPEDVQPWQEILQDISSVWIDFDIAGKKQASTSVRLYTINQMNFLQQNAIGFRLIANATPRVLPEDIKRWENRKYKTEQPYRGNIRSFSQLADVSEGVSRLGVLRMDVDNLGQIMIAGLKNRTMAATSALSWSLDLFFSGWLNQICARVNQNYYPQDHDGLPRGDRLYVIYAGGDDLFVVGSWDLMPELAKEICKDFRRYVCENPDLTISAGITLEDRKFPLYQAAERAGMAVETAKSYQSQGKEKDAVNFLGITVKWVDWETVCEYQKTIIDAINHGAPKALIQVLLNIYKQYYAQLKKDRDKGKPIPEDLDAQVYFGPWMWREVYSLSRMVGREKNQEQNICKLQEKCLNPGYIRSIGLAARWAEFLLQKEGSPNG